jgi:LysM repeat protein
MSCPIGSSSYEIKKGDTIASLSRRFSVPVNELLLLNPDIDPENLSVGQSICIGRTAQSPVKCESGNFYVVRKGDSLYSIARAFEISERELTDANPQSTASLKIGQVLCIPKNPLRIEIVINIKAKTLTVYRNGVAVSEYPIATGREETPTPTGVFTVINKQLDPGGPYGTRWLGLSEKGYGIHGTNDPDSIGTDASNGCIRMFNSDAEKLFDITNTGTVVRILP